MLASTDLQAYAVVALAIAVPVSLLVLRAELRKLRRRRRPDGRAAQQAADTGHPTSLVPRQLTGQQRRLVAEDAADLLGEAGLIATRRGTTITVRGDDGEYVLTVGPTFVTINYVTNLGAALVGRFLSTHRAVAAVVTLTGIPAAA